MCIEDISDIELNKWYKYVKFNNTPEVKNGLIVGADKETGKITF